MKKLKLSIQFSAFLFWVSVLAALMLFVLPTIGCSAVQEIGTKSQTIDKLSQSSEERFVTIADISEVEEVDEQAEHGIIEQRKIQNSVSEIRQVLPRVEDKEPSWMTLLERMSFAGILIAIIWEVLLYFNDPEKHFATYLYEKAKPLLKKMEKLEDE